MKTRRFSAIWLAIAALTGGASFVGGDIAILSGWAFLMWTAPIGPVWWFYLYPMLKNAAILSPLVLQVAGTIGTVVVAYLFWFVAISRLVQRGRNN